MDKLIGKTTRGENVWTFHTPQYCMNYINSYNNSIGFWLRSIQVNGSSEDRLEWLKACVTERNRLKRILSVVLQHEPD